MRHSLGIMGELEDQYDRGKKSYSDGKYSAFIQREQNDPHIKMNRQQGDIFLQYQKGELSREEATDKIPRHALNPEGSCLSMMMMCKGLKGRKNLRMKNFLIPMMYCHLKIEREL